MEWYARILSDAKALQPTTVRALQRTFEAIEREAKGNPVSPHWRDVVNTIANVLSASPEQRSSPPYRRLEAFMLENGDLLEQYPERYFDEGSVGDIFVTGEMTLTREECLEFARRYDPQPFHVNDAAGEASIFGGLAASGWLTGAATMRLIVDSGVMRGPGILGAGVDDLRWLAPAIKTERA